MEAALPGRSRGVRPALPAASSLSGKGRHPHTWRRLPWGSFTSPLDLKGSKLFPQRSKACSGEAQTHSAGNISGQPLPARPATLWPCFGRLSACARPHGGALGAMPAAPLPLRCQTAGRRDGLSLQEVPRSPRMLLEKSGKATDCRLPGIKIPSERQRCRLSQRCRGPRGIHTLCCHPDLSRCHTRG